MIINKVLMALCIVGSLSACSGISSSKTSTITSKPVETVVVKEVEVKRQPPIVPQTDTLKLRDVKWTVVSKQTAEQKLEDGKAYFALDSEGYENVSKNMSDARMVIQQKNAVIQTYRDYVNN